MADSIKDQFNAAADKVICVQEYFARVRDLKRERLTKREKLQKFATVPLTAALGIYRSLDTLGSDAQDELIKLNKDGTAGMYLGEKRQVYVTVATFNKLSAGNPARWAGKSLREKLDAISAQALLEVKDYSEDVAAGKFKPINPRGF